MVEETIVDALTQREFGVRFDWGPVGAAHLAQESGAVVVVDTLSFTTAVSVATGRGAAVIPWALGDDGADELAAARDAALAVPRRSASAERPWSLSPRALMDAPLVSRLVLPSPNGSAIAASFAERSGPEGAFDMLAGCLRNAAATARWLLARGYGSPERPVIVVAAGERWPDGSIRPAVEDVFGAGAIVAGLIGSGRLPPGALSVEARVASATFATCAGGDGLAPFVATCASGRELAAMGYPEEAGIAAALDADRHASVFDGVAFVAVHPDEV